MKVVRHLALAAAFASAGCASAPFMTPPAPGIGRYVYASTETQAGKSEGRYRMVFDLETSQDRVITALVRSAEEMSDGAWRPAVIDDSCRTMLKAGQGEIARVALFPLTPEAAALGSAFMADCAPAALFFPMTDILNVALIFSSPEFGAAGLARPGDSKRFDEFATRFDRLDTAMDARSPGGEIALSALEQSRAMLTWSPDPMELTIVKRGVRGAGPGGEVKLRGEERFAFQVEVDRRTGALIRAATISDVLSMTVEIAGLPPDRAPRVEITRAVTIDPR